jgi:L-ascorbate metabolism protein UlaG (beta-lactamase superfamily)
MKITWFGHSAFRVETGSSVVMIDPFLSGNPTWEGTVEDAAKGATHVVLTHGHDDHLGDTVDICQSSGAVLVANFEICMYLSGQGVENVSPGNHGGRIAFDDFSIAFVQALHSSSSQTDKGAVYLGNPAGVILTPKSGKPLYHMGDTDIFSDMGLINEIYQPKIGIVPIGDRFTMGASLAAMACRNYFAFDTIIPCHYATFPIIDPSADAFLAEMRGQNVLVPERGVAFEV